jgi:hypothetical protein
MDELDELVDLSELSELYELPGCSVGEALCFSWLSPNDLPVHLVSALAVLPTPWQYVHG